MHKFPPRHLKFLTQARSYKSRKHRELLPTPVFRSRPQKRRTYKQSQYYFAGNYKTTVKNTKRPKIRTQIILTILVLVIAIALVFFTSIYTKYWIESYLSKREDKQSTLVSSPLTSSKSDDKTNAEEPELQNVATNTQEDKTIDRITPRKRIATFSYTELLTSDPAIDLQPILPNLKLITPKIKGTVSFKIKATDTWSSILKDNGLDPSLLQRINAAIARIGKVNKDNYLKAEKTIFLHFSPQRTIETITLEIGSGKQLLIKNLLDSKCTATIEELSAQLRQFVATGRITTSLAGDAAKVGVPYDVIDNFVDMFSDRVVFHQDLHQGDLFTILYEDSIFSDETLKGEPEIIAASLLLQGEQMAAIRFKGKDGKFRYFNEKGELLGDNFLRYPLKFSHISSLFSDNRMHPVLNVKMPHNGVDFVAPVGTPIRSVAQGTIISSSWAGACGQMVKIQHNERYSTAYCHLHSISSKAVKGAKIQRGDVIGTLGATGRVTGAHLHYAFFDKGQFVDPLKLKLPTIDLLDAGSRIEKTYLSKAIQTIENYQQIDPKNFMESNIKLSYRDLDNSSSEDTSLSFSTYLSELIKPFYDNTSNTGHTKK